MQRYDGNGTNIDCTIVDCDVCAVGKSHQLAHPKKVQDADTIKPVSLCYGGVMGPFIPKAYGGFQYLS